MMFSFRKILALIFTVSISIVCAIEISLSVNDVEELSNETQMLLLTAVTIDYALYRLLVSFTRHPDPQRPGHNQCAATIWSGRILTLEECIKLYWDLVEFKPVLPQQRNAQLEDFTSFKALEISRGEIQNCIIPFDLILRNTHLWNLISHNRLLYQPSGPIAFHHLSERDLNLLQKNFIRHFVFENPSICGCLTTAAICSLSFIDSEGCRASTIVFDRPPAFVSWDGADPLVMSDSERLIESKSFIPEEILLLNLIWSRSKLGYKHSMRAIIYMTENRFSLNEEFRNLLRGLIYIILSETLWPIMTSTSSTSNWNRIVEIYNALLNNLLTMDSESGNALPPVPFADEFSGADSLKMKRSTIRHGTLLLALIRLIKYKGKSGSTEFIAQMAIDYLTMYNPTFYPPFILRIICDELNRGCIIYVDDAATIEMWSPRHVRRKYFSSNKNRRLNAISRLHPTLIKFWHTGNASINVLNSLPVDDSIPEHLRDKHPSHQLYEISHAGNRESCWSPDSDEPMVWKVGNIRSIIEYWGKIGVDKLSPSKFSFIIQLESPLGEYWRQGDPGRVEHITALKNLLDLLTLPILQHLQCFQYLNSGVWVFVDNNLPMQVVLCHAFVRLVMCGIVTDGRTRVRVPWSFWVNLYVANYLNGPLDTFIDQDPTREFLNAFRKARLFDTVPFIAMHRMYMKEFQSQLSICKILKRKPALTFSTEKVTNSKQVETPSSEGHVSGNTSWSAQNQMDDNPYRNIWRPSLTIPLQTPNTFHHSRPGEPDAPRHSQEWMSDESDR